MIRNSMESQPCLGRLQNVLCMFDLRPVSTGKGFWSFSGENRKGKDLNKIFKGNVIC